MHQLFLPIVVALLLAPVAAHADLAAPCNLIDEEALRSLSFEKPVTKIENKPGVSQSSTNTHKGSVDVCTISRTEGELPALFVATSAVPADALNPTGTKSQAQCKSSSVLGFSHTVCGFTKDGQAQVFILLEHTQAGSDLAKKLQSQVNRLAAIRKRENG